MSLTGQPRLERRLGLGDAVVVGLGAMLGAGVFAAFAPAAQVAGAGLLLGLLVAAVVAYCNATSTAQLAAAYPTSGGVYVYGRERLGPWWGFLAGWCFVVGKTASCAAMALTFATYAVPEAWSEPVRRGVAVAAVLVLTAVTLRGITRTARLGMVLVTLVLVSLGVVVASGLADGVPDPESLRALAAGPAAGWAAPSSWYAVLQAAGLLFFAFAGYARVATLGEEVRDPGTVIPRAIQVALAATVAVYAVVAVTLLLVLGADGVAADPAPLSAVVASGPWAQAEPVVRLGAAAGALGALLALLAGIGRTALAMARSGDLPAWLAAVHPRHHVPHHAELALAGAVCLLVLLADLREVIGFSSFGVLLYYLVANLAALGQAGTDRRFPRLLQVVGLVGCVVLVASLPVVSVAAGVLVVALGVGYRLLRLRTAQPRG